MKSLSSALSELTKLHFLQLNLADNKIGFEGTDSLSAAFIELKNLNSLELNI